MKKLLALGIAILTLTACGAAVPETPEGSTVNPGTSIPNDDYNIARLINVEGVECVVVSSYRTSAVSCNWAGRQ